MAITDDQLDQLKRWATQIGRDGVLFDPSDHEIVGAVFDMADMHNMRTEDEFDALVTIDDLPAPQDHRDIVKAWESGNTIYLRQGGVFDTEESAKLESEGMDYYGNVE